MTPDELVRHILYNYETHELQEVFTDVLERERAARMEARAAKLQKQFDRLASSARYVLAAWGSPVLLSAEIERLKMALAAATEPQ